MQRGHFIGIDVHCEACELAVISASGNVVQRQRCATGIGGVWQSCRLSTSASTRRVGRIANSLAAPIARRPRRTLYKDSAPDH